MSEHPGQTDGLPVWRPAATRLATKSSYALGDLLRFDDIDFIEVAYQALLRRDADPAGRENYLTALRRGLTSKVEILGLIRFSEEGRKCGVHVDGLLLPYKLHQWRHRRVIGPVLGFAMGLARLPRLAMRLQSMEARAAQESQQLGAAMNHFAAEVKGRLDSVDNAVPMAAERAIFEGFAAFEQALDAGLAGSTSAEDGIAIAAPYQRADRREGRYRPGVDPIAFRQAMLGTRGAGAMPPSPVGFDALAASRAIESCARFLNARMVSIDAEAGDRLVQMRAILEAHVRKADSIAARAENHIEAIKEVLSAKADDVKLTAMGAALEELKLSINKRREIAARNRQFLEQNLLASRRELLHLQQRMERLTDRSIVRARPEAAAADTPSEMDAHALDAFYVALEDQFRGSSELITKRCEVYVPVVEAAVKRTRGGALLDIGCGRGEWLRLLQEHGFEAHGIDLNEVMVLECQAAGLDVQQAEAIAHLRGLTDASIAAVTGMHIIEHIPFSSVVALFDEVRRVLKPGGVAIFETPNPENLDVGACSFYMDPTHLHPLPPPLVEYTARAQGFDEVEIRRLTAYRPLPVPPEIKAPEDPESEALQWLLDRSREHLSVAPDYAVVAWKSTL